MPDSSKEIEEDPCLALHKTDGKTHIVGIGNLRVIIKQDDGIWFAQSYEIDYAAEGTSFDDVKDKFENGLKATINEYLTIYGSIEKFLKPAPAEVLVDLMKTASLTKFHSQISMYIPKALPFAGIDYFTENIAA